VHHFPLFTNVRVMRGVLAILCTQRRRGAVGNSGDRRVIPEITHSAKNAVAPAKAGANPPQNGEGDHAKHGGGARSGYPDLLAW
jgi:hypothetical protein